MSQKQRSKRAKKQRRGGIIRTLAISATLLIVFIFGIVALIRYSQDQKLYRPIWENKPSADEALRDSTKTRESFFVDSLRVRLPEYFQDKRFGDRALAAFAKLSEYDSLIGESYSSANGKYRIDILYQTHPSTVEGITQEQVPTLIDAKRRVLKILNRIKPEVVAWEGAGFKSMLYASLPDSILKETPRYVDNLITREAVAQSIEAMDYYDPMTAYLKSNPASLNIGAETLDLNDLHTSVIRALAVHNNSDLENLSTFLQIVRSELSFAKTLLELRAKSLSHGMIVMGAAHRDLEIIILNAGVHSSAYNAVP